MAKKAKDSGGKAPRRAAKAAGEELAPPARESGLAPVPAPIGLEELIGHDHAKRTLINALASDRLHHAWVFHGPAGVGKFTAALAFAALLLDPTTTRTKSGSFATEADSAVGRLLRAGTHPDLHIITKELAAFSDDRVVRESKQITIAKDVIDQHLIRPAALAPALRTQGSRATKVFIIDEAELLDRSPTNAPTQNAILKTLEEPPAGTVIILVTTSPERLLATIRSRCQQVAFAALGEEQMKIWLNTRYAGADTLPPEQAAWYLQHAAGAPGELAAAVNAGLFAWAEQLNPLLARARRGERVIEFGPTMARLVDEFASAAVERNKNASKDAANRDAAEQMFRLLAQDARRELRQAAARGRTEEEQYPALRAIETAREGQRLLEANVNPLFVFDWISARTSEAYRPLTPTP